MTLTPIKPDINAYPAELHQLLINANIYDSSCSKAAQVIFIDKDDGYFLKSAPKDALKHEATMTRYFHSKGVAANVLAYISDERDYMLTTKVHGSDGTTPVYIEQPERLCDIFAERLAELHAFDFSDCPIQNHTEQFIKKAETNKFQGSYDKSHFPDSWGYKNEEEAWSVIEKNRCFLRTDTLLHGDYCLPNIVLNNWKFAAFIDLDQGGVGDRHVDIFWAAWTLYWNLKTQKYKNRFFDAYGRDKIDEEMLRVVAALEVFS